MEAIKTHPGQADALLPGLGDHRQGPVGFALEAALRLGNARRRAARRIGGPGLRQKQPFVDQRHVRAPTQGGKHPDLAVLDFAQPTAPLPRHPHRLGPLLRAPALIDRQRAILVSPSSRLASWAT